MEMLARCVGQLTQRAVIPRVFASGTCPVELHTTDATNVVLGHVPPPGCHSIPLLDGDLHACDRDVAEQRDACNERRRLREANRCQTAYVGGQNTEHYFVRCVVMGSTCIETSVLYIEPPHAAPRLDPHSLYPNRVLFPSALLLSMPQILSLDLTRDRIEPALSMKL